MKDLWGRFREGLTRTRDRIGDQVGSLLGTRVEPDPEALERLEEALLAADVGPATTERLLSLAPERMARERVDLRTALERCAADLLGRTRAPFEPGDQRPWVALLAGVNGVGKTTLAGKLAAAFARSGRKTMLVAADTFRAAASEQLDVWATRAGVELVRAAPGADPAAVAHDGVSAAIARGHQAVIVDTAGRLHTKHNLMAELEKVARVCGRLAPGAPHHLLLVLDATLGQNGIAQAREFHARMPVTSLAVNKLDGTARGGAVLAIADQLGLPISVVGLGEGIDDWEPFDPEAFAKGLFG
ncbi:MAG TPA: signal recognition particle-docking protein FtsY [Candidatus Eisenbacteria bacterium]|nr:signal recognition particle-docking protein FtsY [Candidatus Eisenbacteria bacterium]